MVLGPGGGQGVRGGGGESMRDQDGGGAGDAVQDQRGEDLQPDQAAPVFSSVRGAVSQCS